MHGESRLRIHTRAACGAAARDIGEPFDTDAVEPRIEETEGLEAFGDAGVVEEGDDGGEDGAGGRGAAREGGGVVVVDRVAEKFGQRLRLLSPTMPQPKICMICTYSGLRLWAETSGKPRPLLLKKGL